ncbi:hypothetical protein Pmani_006470 [Petrolisthes manimaculis]|uniref:Uncharacterized protein n=1 Tax=Petrolisthes manimaculis TaxID=1843537 RepID=A0AAE1ULU0_9EUCA|nr:hypothetical protein Pmani_006470 [Petrolisthes manimaculis]
MVVTRLLEQYSALVLYFTDAVLNERLLVCENTLRKLQDPTTKVYLQFLDFALPIFNGLDKQMQSETSQIHTICKSVIASYTTFVECYLKDEYVEKCPLHELRLSDPHNFKDLKNMYFGAAVEATLSQPHSIPPQAVEQFKLKCLDFYIEGALQISKRFPFDNKVFQLLEALDPKVVEAKSVPSLAPLMNYFPLLVSNATLQKIDTEWRMLRSKVSTILANNPDMTPIKFWVKVSVMTAGDGT